jgi:hypothetical protein
LESLDLELFDSFAVFWRGAVCAEARVGATISTLASAIPVHSVRMSAVLLHRYAIPM